MIIEIKITICNIFCVECLNDNEFGSAYEIGFFVTQLDRLSGGLAELVSSVGVVAVELYPPSCFPSKQLIKLMTVADVS